MCVSTGPPPRLHNDFNDLQHDLHRLHRCLHHISTVEIIEQFGTVSTVEIGEP